MLYKQHTLTFVGLGFTPLLFCGNSKVFLFHSACPRLLSSLCVRAYASFLFIKKGFCAHCLEIFTVAKGGFRYHLSYFRYFYCAWHRLLPRICWKNALSAVEKKHSHSQTLHFNSENSTLFYFQLSFCRLDWIYCCFKLDGNAIPFQVYLPNITFYE